MTGTDAVEAWGIAGPGPSECTDPVVAVFYAAMAYPSLAAGLVAAVDLVAGQQGPWVLAGDPARAGLAAELVCRVTGPAAITSLTGPGASAPPVPVGDPQQIVAIVERCALDLGRAWAEHRDSLPAATRLRIEQLEAQCRQFLDIYRDGIPAGSGTKSKPAPLPSPELAQHYRPDQWHVLFRDAGLKAPDVMAEMRDRVTAAGKEPPANLRGVRDRLDVATVLLDIISKAAG